MKRFVLILILLLAAAPAFSQEGTPSFKVNDSLTYKLTPQESGAFLSKQDSAARLEGGCGIGRYFQQTYFPVFYRNGVAYLLAGENMVLFSVMIKETQNKITIGSKSIAAGLTQKSFEKGFKEFKGSKEEVERTKGIKEIAYTIHPAKAGEISYRVFFRDGKVHSMLLYISC